MKAKMIAVAVAGMLVGCGSGGGSVEFQSQKGEPEVLEVLPEFKIETAKGEGLKQDPLPEYKIDTQKGQPLVNPEKGEFHLQHGQGAVNEVPEADISRYGLTQEEKPEFNGPVHGEGLVHEVNPYTQNGQSLIQEQYAYAEETAKGEPLIQGFKDAYVEHSENGDPAFNEVEELAICEREGLQDQETCQRALSLIETGISEAKGEFDKNPQAFQIQSKAIVGTAENTIKRQTKRDATYPEVIEFLVMSMLEEETFENRYAAAGYAIATYYYVRGIPEGHSNTGNPGLCADKGYCGNQYLKYQWN